MEFWGAEVKVGEVVKVDPTEFEACLHLSQVALGEAMKDKPSEPVLVYLKVIDQKFVLGTLSREKFPQIALDLVLEKEFEISHNSKSASVHFCGYKSFFPDDEDDLSDDSDEEDFPLPITENGNTATKAEVAKASQSKKPDAKAAAPVKQVKVFEPKKDEEEGSDDDSDDDSDEDDESGSDDEMEDADSDSDEEGDSDEDEGEEDTPPKKVVDQGKKRPNDSAPKTPVSNKKAKNATPEKTDGKKGGHTATPHPAKKGGKSPGSEAPKSGGNISCKSCSKSFNSESGLQQHNKAKHGQ